jgi:hypothetical protein
MRSFAALLLITCLCRLSAQSQLFREKIRFDYKSSRIPAKSLKQIKGIWDLLPKNTSVELVLVSDKEIKKLDPAVVVTLSRARAEAIKLFLLNQKLAAPHNIELYFHSWIEVDPIPGTRVAFNRIVRDPYKVHSLILNRDLPICYYHTDAERFALNSKTPTVFAIDPKVANTIKGPAGVVVEIPPYALNVPGDRKGEDVIIKLWEFISDEDILAAGLTTTSAGRLLETGGMIYITAECAGICLKLRYNARITVKFPIPDTDRLDGMRLFKGIPQQEIIDWKETGSKDSLGSLPSTLPSFDGEPSSVPDGDLDSGEVAYYTLESAGFGWINCDRFTEASERINVAYTSSANFKGIATLVFIDMKSMLGGDFKTTPTGNVQFYNVPKGKDAVLLVYTLSPDRKKFWYHTQRVTLGDPLKEEIKMTETTAQGFKDMLRDVRNVN